MAETWPIYFNPVVSVPPIIYHSQAPQNSYGLTTGFLPRPTAVAFMQAKVTRAGNQNIGWAD